MSQPAAPSHAMETSARGPGSSEPIELTYARHTRNAVVFIAVLAGVAAAITLIGVIIMANQISALNHAFSNPSSSSSSSTNSNCESQGGTDPTC